VYSNHGCLDGVLQSTFNAWGPEPTCEICPLAFRPGLLQRRVETVPWGELRNSPRRLQVTTGGNRADFNDDPRVHEVPEFLLPRSGRLAAWTAHLLELPAPLIPTARSQLYHSVGNATVSRCRWGRTEV